MNRTERNDWADTKFAQYLVCAEYREWTSSAKPSVTGFVSECCRSETRILADGERVACIECGRVCQTSSWWSPLSGIASRGGWDPSPVWRDGAWRVREQLMYINETRARNTRAEDERRARGTEAIRSLTYLFDGRPRGITSAAWERTKLAWEGMLGRRDPGYVAARAIYFGRDPALWTAENILAWVDTGRAIAWERFERARGRRREHPWAGAEWAAMAATRAA